MAAPCGSAVHLARPAHSILPFAFLLLTVEARHAKSVLRRTLCCEDEFARAREPNNSDCTNCRCVIDAVYRRLLQAVGRNSRKRLNRSRTLND